MDFLSDNQNLFISLLLVWNIVLTFVVLYFLFSWKKIFKEASGQSIKEALERSIKQSDILKEKVFSLENIVNVINQEKLSFFKKTAFLRFNPFGDTGGNQSFIWTCLDSEDNGLVLSSLHGREGTRVYAKKISKGEAVDSKLSSEEEQVLKEAATEKKRL